MDLEKQRLYRAPQVDCLECGQEMMVVKTWKFLGYIRRKYVCNLCQTSEVITATGALDLERFPDQAVKEAKKLEKSYDDEA